MERTETTYVSDFGVSLAMWADESLFGHDLPDDEYEGKCERFADDLAEHAFATLMDRPVR
jgi:hypothetical protein